MSRGTVEALPTDSRRFGIGKLNYSRPVRPLGNSNRTCSPSLPNNPLKQCHASFHSRFHHFPLNINWCPSHPNCFIIFSPSKSCNDRLHQVVFFSETRLWNSVKDSQCTLYNICLLACSARASWSIVQFSNSNFFCKSAASVFSASIGKAKVSLISRTMSASYDICLLGRVTNAPRRHRVEF